MLLFTGLNLYLLLFLAIALAPAIYLMVYVYRLDPIDKEPAGLLWSLVVAGGAAALVAGLIETVGMQVFGLFSGLDPNSVQFTVAADLLVVGLVEEGMKYVLMGRRTWHARAFNCRFDGVVYAVFTSLGFAAVENVMYGLTYGTGVLFARAFMAIPAHMGFAVLFGMFYGQGKLLDARGHGLLSKGCVAMGYLLSVGLHGLYDSTAMVQTEESMGAFFVVVIAIYLINFVIARAAARRDKRFQ